MAPPHDRCGDLEEKLRVLYCKLPLRVRPDLTV